MLDCYTQRITHLFRPDVPIDDLAGTSSRSFMDFRFCPPCSSNSDRVVPPVGPGVSRSSPLPSSSAVLESVSRPSVSESPSNASSFPTSSVPTVPGDDGVVVSDGVSISPPGESGVSSTQGSSVGQT